MASWIRLLGWLLEVALLFAECVPAALAETWPSRPMRPVVLFAAGSATDAMARALARELAGRLGQNAVLDNRAGACGKIAAVQVARAAPDSRTVLVTTNTTHSANPHVPLARVSRRAPGTGCSPRPAPPGRPWRVSATR